MTETARTVIELTTALSRWLQSHVVSGGEIVRQIVPVMIVFGFVNMTNEQQAVLFSAISGVVAAITGHSTVSKVRVGQRISEAVDKERADVFERAEIIEQATHQENP